MRIAKLCRLVGAVRNWPRPLIDHIQLTTDDYVCRLRNGASFEVRGGTDDRHVIFEVFVERIYSVQVSRGDTVVDIGAHIGCFTVLAAKSGARVLSFEPNPGNFAVLERNVRLNGLENVIIFQTAISGRRESRNMVLPDNPAHSGRYSLHPGRGAQKIKVPCISLDDVVHENNLDRIDLLKIDCQGSEYEILYEASAQTLARTQTIIVECEVFEKPADWSTGGMVTWLKKQGFNTRTRGNLVYADRHVSQTT